MSFCRNVLVYVLVNPLLNGKIALPFRWSAGSTILKNMSTCSFGLNKVSFVVIPFLKANITMGRYLLLMLALVINIIGHKCLFSVYFGDERWLCYAIGVSRKRVLPLFSYSLSNKIRGSMDFRVPGKSVTTFSFTFEKLWSINCFHNFGGISEV